MGPALSQNPPYRKNGDMAHMVFKKHLQNQTTRENYIKQRQELRHAKEMGFIDVQAYEDAKKNLLPDAAAFDSISISPPMISVVDSDSIMSGGGFSSLPPEIRKGSILDRNNVGRLVYKQDAQGHESRGEQKELRKAQKAQERFSKSKSYHHGDSILNIAPSAQLTPGPYSMHLPTPTTTSDSPKSAKPSSQRINFNIFRRLSASTSRNPPPVPLLDPPPVTKARASTRPKRHSEFSDTSSISKSSIVRRNTESHGGGGSAMGDVLPITFADIFLLGSSPKVKSEGSSRRHSFSNQNARPSFTSSGAETEAAEGAHEFIFESRPSSSEFGQPFPHSPEEPISPRGQPQQPPLSTATQDVFLSLLNEFSNTSILFSYPKYGRAQHDSLPGSFRSVSCPPGNGESEEVEEVGGAVGEGSFLIDESAVILEAILEKRIWFLMAMKWLSFGRVLFSPGHYIIELSSDAGVGMKGPEANILDLDGAITADWSWHLADEYPFATIFNVLLPHSPRPPRNTTAPANLQFLTATTLSNLSALPSNSIDVITSHNIPRLLLRDKRQSPEELHVMLTAIFRECARVLKPSGYFEITAVDPVMNNMGPRTREWIMEYIAPFNNTKPSKMILAALEQLSGKQSKELLFEEVKECWVWMPTTSIGDELSTVTSMVGRHLYNELFAPAGEEYDGEQRVEVSHGVSGKRECKLWKDEKVIEECQNENTAFRWLKCYARKV